METQTQPRTKPKYIFGFDIGSGLWIVGLRTQRGTIKDEDVAESFVSAEDAEKKCKELNGN